MRVTLETAAARAAVKPGRGSLAVTLAARPEGLWSAVSVESVELLVGVGLMPLVDVHGAARL